MPNALTALNSGTKCLLAQLLSTPPAGYVPAGTVIKANARPRKEDFLPIEMLKTWQFYVLWFMYACGAGAGLMVISVATKVNSSAGVGVLAVVALAIGNGGGRILAGIISDKLGRKLTLFIFFILQACMIFALSQASADGSKFATAVILVGISALIGANYGSNLALFPSI